MDARPSPRIAELLRRGASMALRLSAEEINALSEQTLAHAPLRPIADDPVLNAGARRSIRSSMRHWSEANVHEPGAPVAAHVGAEPLSVARDLVRRGLDEPALHTYRAAQTVAWERWMAIAFEIADDPTELHALLEVSWRSISDFIGSTMEAISSQMQAEHAQLTRGTQAEKREVVTLVLDGAPISDARAATRLGYPVGGHHNAVIVWTERPKSDVRVLERVAAAVAGGRATLTVLADTGTLWVWVAGPTAPDLTAATRTLASTSDVRLAVGPPGLGVDGFRASHRGAVVTQRLLTRLHSEQQLASFPEVQLVALLTEDPARAAAFVSSTLGDFATASAELREAVRIYLNEQSNAARAAKRLFTHRNTLLRRLARADQLLPRPLAEHGVDVAVALEVLRWQGSAEPARPSARAR